MNSNIDYLFRELSNNWSDKMNDRLRIVFTERFLVYDKRDTFDLREGNSYCNNEYSSNNYTMTLLTDLNCANLSDAAEKMGVLYLNDKFYIPEGATGTIALGNPEKDDLFDIRDGYYVERDISEASKKSAIVHVFFNNCLMIECTLDAIDEYISIQ